MRKDVSTSAGYTISMPDRSCFVYKHNMLLYCLVGKIYKNSILNIYIYISMQNIE